MEWDSYGPRFSRTCWKPFCNKRFCYRMRRVSGAELLTGHVSQWCGQRLAREGTGHGSAACASSFRVQGLPCWVARAGSVASPPLRSLGAEPEGDSWCHVDLSYCRCQPSWWQGGSLAGSSGVCLRPPCALETETWERLVTSLSHCLLFFAFSSPKAAEPTGLA